MCVQCKFSNWVLDSKNLFVFILSGQFILLKPLAQLSCLVRIYCKILSKFNKYERGSFLVIRIGRHKVTSDRHFENKFLGKE